MGAGRLVLRPTRAVAGDMLEPVAEAAVDRALAGPLPEAVARSLVEHHVIERVTREVLASADFQAAVSSALDDEATERFLTEAMKSKLTSRLAEQLLKGPEFERLLTEVLSSPAVSAALAKQTTTIGDEMVGSVRDSTVELDTRLERGPRRFFHRAARPDTIPPTPYAGFGTRGVALAVDALLAQTFFLVGAGMVGLIADLSGGVHPRWLAAAIAASGWVIVQIVYFAGFWSVVGRTPGMHLMGLRVQCAGGGRPGVFRSLVRLAGLWLAIVIAFLGFAPVFVDDRRRALQDFLAGTEVVYVNA
jgi:uncharacterized RDD family membrane protein YckC